MRCLHNQKVRFNPAVRVKVPKKGEVDMSAWCSECGATEITIGIEDDRIQWVYPSRVTPTPTLTEMFGPQLQVMDKVVRRARRGKHKGDPSLKKGADYNFVKSDGHICRIGPTYDGMDEDTGAPHTLLAGLRLMFVDRCARGSK